MIGQLTGTIQYIHSNPIIINVSGVGYEVMITPKMFAGLSVGTTSTIFIHTHVRDDAIELFGFPNREDLDLFHLLITVSGVGPKTALLVIDRGNHQVKTAISKSDVDFFTTVPRLGKKNAQKIIIELKNKLGSFIDLDLSDGSNTETTQLVDALMNMGFAKPEILSVYKSMDFKPDIPLAEKIRLCLRALSKFG